jgi:3-deoxy-7-phosphoheptulonate synthase
VSVRTHPAADSVRDQRIERLVPLVAPQALLEELPLRGERARVLLAGRAAAHAIIDGEDDRLLVVVGPCSVHDVRATHEYAQRLAAEAARLGEELCVAMRVYFEKPRTTIGWKGLINDPHLDGSGDVNAGLSIARRLLLDVLEVGLPVGCEFLDPITPQYIADAVCWGAIGARTTESQIHRQLGSGLSMPVGFKNRTDGNIQVAVDAVRAAAAPHAFAGIDVDGTPAILHTRGNADCHIILRGGRGAPNYDVEHVARATALLRAAGLPERLMIDLSHDNSGKVPERQAAVADAVAEQIAADERAVIGVMLESFLVGGRQDPGPLESLRYGQSITDGCVGWTETVEILDRLAGAVRSRRQAGRQSRLPARQTAQRT